jgi:hypothetical protein
MRPAGSPPWPQAVVALADHVPGDYALFGRPMERSADLAAGGQFDQAVWVADQMIAGANGKSGLRPRRGRRYRGLGVRVAGLARQAKEQILAICQETDAHS